MTINNAAILTLSLTLAAAGQEVIATPPAGEAHLEVFEHRVAAPSGNVMFQAAPIGGLRQMAVEYVGAESGISGQVVKGMPYSAESVTETTQALADGNHIRNKTTSQMFRDAEGRTRREPSLGTIALAPDVMLPQLVFINDPVSGFHYVLDVKERTAQKAKIGAVPPHMAELKMKLEAEEPGMRTAGTAGTFFGHTGVAMAGGEAGAVRTMTYSRTATLQNAKTESLGRQTMEGVPVDGTRSTWSIPAGEIGNEREIDVVSERWYSPELQTVIMSRHSDPRLGETVFRLTNISRSDPPRTLFEPPADYKVTESGGGDIIACASPLPPA